MQFNPTVCPAFQSKAGDYIGLIEAVQPRWPIPSKKSPLQVFPAKGDRLRSRGVRKGHNAGHSNTVPYAVVT